MIIFLILLDFYRYLKILIKDKIFYRLENPKQTFKIQKKKKILQTSNGYPEKVTLGHETLMSAG